MPQVKPRQSTDVIAQESHQRWLYAVGAAGALLSVVAYVAAAAVYFPAYAQGPPPSTVLDWFSLLRDDPITGLFFLGLADIVMVVIWVPMLLAIFAAIRRTNKACLAVATCLALVGTAVYLATNIAFSMLYLSEQYAAATNEAQQAMVLAAGQAAMSLSRGTGGYTGLPLVWIACLMFSACMLQSKVFKKATAYVGVVGFALHS